MAGHSDHMRANQMWRMRRARADRDAEEKRAKDAEERRATTDDDDDDDKARSARRRSAERAYRIRDEYDDFGQGRG